MFLAASVLATTLATAFPAFTDATEAAGIPQLRHGEGVVAADFTGDGLPDLYLPNVRGRGRLLKNLGGARFSEITDNLNVNDSGGVGAAAADLNGDGLLDLYIARGADPYAKTNLVLFQRADTSFEDSSATAGVSRKLNGISVTLADFNQDGAIDAFLPGWGADTLFVNDGRGGFSENLRALGDTPPGRSWTSLASDLNHDGRLDLFISRGSYEKPRDSRLLLNRGGGLFTDATEGSGLANAPWSMGAVSADFNGDGFTDLYVPGYNGPGRLYKNDGQGKFTDVTAGSGLDAPMCVGASAGFVDGDLLPDLAVAGFAGPVKLYRNLGEMRFAEVGREAGIGDFVRTEGLLLVDLDGDGDLDLYVTNLEGKNRLYLNNLNDPRYLVVRFKTTSPPRVGAVARLYKGATLLATLELSGAVGLAQGPEEFFFRLPEGGPFDLDVTLPGGRKLKATGLTGGKVVLE